MKIISSNIILISLLWIGLVSCGKNANDKSVDQDTVSVITLISPEDLNSANDNILLIDVRTPNEYASGHIQNSVNIDYRAENFKELIQELDKNQDVYVYCKVGGRSGSLLLERASKAVIGEIHLCATISLLSTWTSVIF